MPRIGNALSSLTLAVIVCCCLLPYLTLSAKENVRAERRMGPGRPGDRTPKNPPKGTRETSPPVSVNFTTSCRLQQEEYRHITCTEDGNFTDIQCKGRTCYCVDTETGERLNSRGFSEREKLDKNCSAEFKCPSLVGCTKVCDSGLRLDEDDCATCRCAPRPPSVRCSTVTMLIKDEGCHCGCVMTGGDATPRGGPRTRMRAMCPSCDESCNMNPPDSVEGCAVTNPDQCPEGTTLQSVGRSGNPMCVTDLDDASDCDPAVDEEDGPGPRPKGADRRKRARDLRTATTPCRRGFVCRQIGFMEYQCFAENSESPCAMARANDPDIKCEPNGNFRPLQCHPVVESPDADNSTNVSSTSEEMTRSRRTRTRTTSSSRGQQNCRCVEPVNGTTIEGSELLLGVRDKRPNCDDVYQDCEVPAVHQHRGPRKRRYRVRHGEDYFDTANCRTCQCTNGDLTSFCTPMANCSVLLPDNTADNCTLEDGEVLLHSETRQVGCDVCGCKDGRLRCTHQKDCEDKEDNTTMPDPCDMCRDEPTSPVCGPDGRNHLSRCTAIYCAGIPAVELKDGPCQSQDVCSEYPCDGNKVCVRRGAVACMATSGCTPDQLRTCVNISALNCPIEISNGTNSTSEESFGENAVCGSDNETYSSLCQLVQTTTNIHVSHTGPCEDPECQGGQVCGSDGVTYPSSCALESLATTRVDYPGACESGTSAEDICMSVVNGGRCVVNSNNCAHVVFPDDGCCPICGGSVSVVVDRVALSDVARSNPELQTMDVFAFRMTEDKVFEGVEGRCTIEATPTDTSDLQLALTATNDRHSGFCLQKSEEIAERVNTGNLPPDGSSQQQPSEPAAIVPLPQVYEFAMAAVASQEVVDSSTTTDDTRGGSPGLFHTTYYCSIAFACFIAAILHLV